MKIVTVVGARPQFIKAAVVSREIRKFHKEILVHTGQHYDYNMSDVFFKELDIPNPDYNLGISGGSHGTMTGKMLIAIEEVLIQEKPDMVLVYGDTNSTMAGALAAVKLHIPVCHVEAGGRLGTIDNPEEVNRIVTDHISSILLCCTNSAIDFLKSEGKIANVHLVGDPMYDAFMYYSKKIKHSQPEILKTLNNEDIDLPENYYYMTCHRQENTGSIATLKEILKAMNSQKYPCIYPVHPRNQKDVQVLIENNGFENVICCQPVGYLMSIYLILHAEKIVTDSGGLQREAFFAEKQCITVFDHVVWPETMINNRNQLSRANCDEICSRLITEQKLNNEGQPFGDGHAATKIVSVINQFEKKMNI